MNRLLGLLPHGEAKAIAVSATVPVALRGPHEVASYAPSALPEALDDLLAARRRALCAGSRSCTPPVERGDGRPAAWPATCPAAAARTAPRPARSRRGCWRGADGARIAMIETGGWDTHSRPARPARPRSCAGSTRCSASLKTGLGADWANTLVLVATEFGRTAAANGTGGTDHGTASAGDAGRRRGRRAAACSPTGRASRRPRSTKAATSSRRSTSTR